MHCQRCRGVMREDQFFDVEGTQGLIWMKGWRCTQCGHATDPLIYANCRLNALDIHRVPHALRPARSPVVPEKADCAVPAVQSDGDR